MNDKFFIIIISAHTLSAACSLDNELFTSDVRCLHKSSELCEWARAVLLKMFLIWDSLSWGGDNQREQQHKNSQQHTKSSQNETSRRLMLGERILLISFMNLTSWLRGGDTKMVWMLPVDLRLVGSFTRIFTAEWMCQTATTTMEFWQWHDGRKGGSWNPRKDDYENIQFISSFKTNYLARASHFLLHCDIASTQIPVRGLFLSDTRMNNKPEDGCDVMMIFTIQHGEKGSFRPNREKEKKIICSNKRRTNGANKILNGTLGSAEWWWQRDENNGRRS